MFYIFRVVIFVIFVFFFSACQSSTSEIEAKVIALQDAKKNEESEIQNLKTEIQQKDEKIIFLKDRNGDPEKIAELEQERDELEKQLQHKERMVAELNRVIYLPAQVAKGRATEEEVQECIKLFNMECRRTPPPAHFSPGYYEQEQGEEQGEEQDGPRCKQPPLYQSESYQEYLECKRRNKE